MANLKNITELPVAESTEGLNLIVNDNGAAKQIAADAVGVKSYNDLEDKPCYTEVDNEGNETVHKLDAKYLPDVGSSNGDGMHVLLNIADAIYTESSNIFYFVSPEIWTACHNRKAVNIQAAYTDFVYFPISYSIPTGTVDDEYSSFATFVYDMGANGTHTFFYLYIFGNENAAFNYYDR